MNPQDLPEYDDKAVSIQEITLRDYFAAKAMQGLIERGFTEFGNAASGYANLAFEYADAMMKARKK